MDILPNRALTKRGVYIHPHFKSYGLPRAESWPITTDGLLRGRKRSHLQTFCVRLVKDTKAHDDVEKDDVDTMNYLCG